MVKVPTFLFEVLNMQVITAKDAKSRFGELLDTMQRESVLDT